jgi:hypothetical protein
MDRYSYASSTLRKVCRKFDDKHHGTKFPYFVIYVIAMDDPRKGEWHRSITDSELVKTRDRPKTVKKGFIDKSDGEEYVTVTGRKRTRTTEVTEKKSTDNLGRTFSNIQKHKTTAKHYDEIETWNIYDVLPDIQGEIHELDEMPSTNLISLERTPEKVFEVKVTNYYEKRINKLNEVNVLGFKKDIPLCDQNLQDLANEVFAQNLVPQPFVYHEFDDKYESSNMIEELKSTYKLRDKKNREKIEYFLRGLGVNCTISTNWDVDVDSINHDVLISRFPENINHFGETVENYEFGINEDDDSGDDYVDDDYD